MSIKKAMLEKMFPKEGENVPEIRFKEFEGTWKKWRLGEIGQTYSGLAGKTKKDFGHGEARFVTYMNVFSNPVIDPDMTEPVEIDSKQHEVEIGDVFFTTSSETPDEVGMTSVYSKNSRFSPTFWISFQKLLASKKASASDHRPILRLFVAVFVLKEPLQNPFVTSSKRCLLSLLATVSSGNHAAKRQHVDLASSPLPVLSFLRSAGELRRPGRVWRGPVGRGWWLWCR